jgi:hypothetical protein
VDQLRATLPGGWSASLLAVDGSVTADVEEQIKALPQEATHLVVSCGGNDALGYLPVLADDARSVADALERLAGIRADFAKAYRRMLAKTLATRKPVTVCTIYDCIPDLEPAPRTALALFNEVILREAVAAAVGIVDLRLVCGDRIDYSELSPIEPSRSGGEKIARAIRDALLGSGAPDTLVRVHL